MKVTAQEEYGLRCILRLARARSAETPKTSKFGLTVNEVAESEGLSVQYAGKLIRVLGKAGLVESVRGCKGGYRLARPSKEISVAETLAALGGKMYEPKVCERYTGDRQFCVHTNDCSIRSLWSGLQLMIDQVLSRTTLRDLVGHERTMVQWMAANAEALRSFAGDYGSLESQRPDYQRGDGEPGEDHPATSLPVTCGQLDQQTNTMGQVVPSPVKVRAPETEGKETR